jgi:hypothetical protein
MHLPGGKDEPCPAAEKKENQNSCRAGQQPNERFTPIDTVAGGRSKCHRLDALLRVT